MCLGALLLAGCSRKGGPQASALRSALAAESSSRAVEGRLTGIPFAPYQPGDVQWSGGMKTARRGSPQDLADRATLRLFDGNPDQAVALLEDAADQEPRNAGVLNDLAVAYLTRAENGVRPEDLVRALSAAERAVQTDRGLAEARFNRALALEKLFLNTAALQAWREIALRERDNGWSREAEEHLRRLSAPPETEIWQDQRSRLDAAALRGDDATVAALVDRFRQPVRQYAEEELLARWAEAASEGRAADAERFLRIARAIGAALVQGGADAMVHDAVKAIDQARETPERFTALCQGHSLYGAGLKHYKVFDLNLAFSELSRAERLLADAETPFVHWARFYLASTQYQQMQLEPALEAFQRLRTALNDDRRYPSLLGNIVWVLASIEILHGRPGDALPLLDQGQQLFSRTKEAEGLAAMHQHFAIAFGNLGASDETWQSLYRALQTLSRVHSSKRRFAILDEAGVVCLRNGRPDVALYFQTELLALARQIDIPDAIATALLRRSWSLRALRRTGEALQGLGEALVLTERLKGPPGRLRANILAARAEIRLASDPASAALDLTQALRFFESSGLHFEVSSVYVLRARADLAAGATARARESFQTALHELERIRGSVVDPRLRIEFYDQATAFLDEFLDFQVLHEEQPRAFTATFELSEQGRARELLESLSLTSMGRSAPRKEDRRLRVDEIQAMLPERTLLVKYAVLKDRSLVWILTRQQAELRQIAMGEEELGSRVARIRRLIAQRSPSPELSRLLRELYTILIKPVDEAAGKLPQVIFIPDKSLHLLPFAALVDPSTNRYLIEDRAIGVAPSANVYARCLARSRARAGLPLTTALVLSGEAFDRSRFPRLKPLREARKEAEHIAAAYPEARLLTGAEATPGHLFQGAAAGPDIIHLAVHSVPRSDFAENSTLLLAPAPEKNGDGAVYSYEVYGLRLDRTRLVALSACSTASGRLSASEGAMSIARPFLAAGAPAVLATLWRVEDTSAYELSTRFHERLLAGNDALSALRAAQLSFLASHGKQAHPASWAPFELIGGIFPTLQGGQP